MWPNISVEVADRIQAARAYFTAIAGLPFAPPASPPLIPHAETAAKGLMFVQLYAIYEFTVCGVVRAAWQEINRRGATLSSIRLEMLGVALDAELTAALECGVGRTWEKRMALFRRVSSTDNATFRDDLFPADGSHYRVKQLQTIWDLLGIPGHPLPRMPLIGLIDLELVEHRNAIAHGRKTAEEVGRSYSISDIHQKIDHTQDVCMHIIATTQTHCSNPANLLR